MEYDSLYKDFTELFPDDKEELDLISRNAAAEESDGMHVMFGMVVVPYILILLKNRDEDKLKKAFDYFEQMSLSEDLRICEVVEFTILEDLISQGNEVVYEFKKYMRKETLECFIAVEKYMMQV
jgi:hypothetical protein